MERGKNKIVKKVIAYLLVFALCVPLLGVAAQKKTAEAKDDTLHLSSDWNWWYTINDDGTAEIYAKYRYGDASDNLIIPAVVDGFRVTSIAEGAFYKESGLLSVTIPDGVINIGNSAFYECFNLSKVVIPDSVTIIGNHAFFGCYNLSEIVIPSGVSKIGWGAFGLCLSFKKIVIPSSVTSIDGYAFFDCSNLSEVVIPEGVINIGDGAFCECYDLSEIVIPNSVTNIGNDAFYGCPASLVIYAAPGSYAETYANNNGITVKTDAVVNPVVTPTPTPTPTSIPTPACVSPLPPTPTPTATPIPIPELQVSANITELTADTQGNFLDNRVDVFLTNTYECSVSTGSSSWLKVCNKNASASASSNIWLYNSEKEGICSFYVFADENTSITPRKGEITITASDWDKTVKTVVEVTQEAGKAVLEVSATEITANSKGKTNISSVKVSTDRTGGFSVSNDGNSWIKLGSSSYESSPKAKISFEAGGTFYVFVSENPSDEERTGRIIVTHEDGETKEVIEVRQDGAGASLSVDSTSKMADNSGTFYNNAVYVDTSDTGSFTATVEGASWLKVSTESFASFADGMTSITLGGNAYIYLVADKNTGAERTATIKITHEGGKVSKTVTVTQLGKAASYLEVDRETAYFDEPTRAIDGMIHISADENTKWTVTASKSWIKILKEDWLYAEEYASIEGTGSSGFYILVKENDTYKDRDGYVTISAPGLESHTIYVHQAENEISLDTLLQELSISVTKKTFKKGKTTKIKLNYPEGLYASDIKSVKFSSSKKKVATVNSKGVVKGIKKGKAVISVKVTLENGSSKTFKAKITVDKRKVKLAKFK